MSIRSVLVPMNAVSSDQSTLDLALAVARPFAAHIQALFVRPDAREALGAAGVGVDAVTIDRIMAQIEHDGVEAAKRARGSFERWCAKHGLDDVEQPVAAKAPTAHWREVEGVPDRVIPQRGGTADLIVETAAGDPALGWEQATIESSLFGTGRPVLVAPLSLPADLFATALVAWNGSVEANHAVAAALPLVARCQRVFVFTESEALRPDADIDGLIANFAWHGVAARRVFAPAAAGSIGERLLAAAGQIGASLLVMGAYTHGRVRQMVFGGVTSHVLQQARIPVLLAH